MTGFLALEDGTVFRGESVAADGFAVGEAVFTTAMTGYQEIVTDPSFAEQLICFTAPMVGNYGVAEARAESREPHAKAAFMRALSPAMRTSEMNRAAGIINSLVVEAAAQMPHVVLVPTYSLTSDPKGGYITHFKDLQGRVRLMRLSDGLHFTEPGYTVLAHHALARLSEVSGRFRAIAEVGPASQTR